MSRKSANLIENLIANKRLLFGVDGVGAFVSAFVLGIVLPSFQVWIGLPLPVLIFLSLLALTYSIYSLFNASGIIRYRPIFLKIIIAGNIFYCATTVFLLIVFYAQVRPLGWAYFLGELTIISGLVGIEMRAVRTGSVRSMKFTAGNYQFREAVSDDISEMKRIRDHVRENPLISGKIEFEDYQKALFEDGKGWVCTYQGKIVGFSCGRLKQNDVWALFLDSAHEGKGIGNHLMELLENWMFKNGCQEIKLSTDPNTRAEYLYRKRGWIEVGILPNKEIEFTLKRSYA